MANHMDVNDLSRKSSERTHATQNKSEKWGAADAARFLFKGQCYDAGPGSDTTCSLCGTHIRLVYVLKVLESPSHSCAQEAGKLNAGECCFKPIGAVNERLYRQLLAGAVNLRTYIEAIERDQRIFQVRQDAVAPEKVRLPRLEVLGAEEDRVRELFEALLSDGGDHA